MRPSGSPRHHEILIVGSGSGNSLITDELAGRDIALVDHGVADGRFGGTCLNVGCIPTKMLVYPADVISYAREVARLGVDFALPQVDWPAIRDRVFADRIDLIQQAGREYRAGSDHVTLYEGTARFTGPRALTVTTPDGEYQLTADQVVIANGSRPQVVAPFERVDPSVGIHTSDTIMRVAQVPERLTIIGSGFIAAEMAHVFGSFGSAVTIVARGQVLLRHVDEPVRQRYNDVATNTYDVRFGVSITTAERIDDVWQLTLGDGSVLAADAVLLATGRDSNADLLGLPGHGIEVDQDGHVVVDVHQQTAVPGVWALGDVANTHQLKHVANHEARVVAHNLAHPDHLARNDPRPVPWAIFGHPQVAGFGPTRAELEAAGTPFLAKEQDFGSVAYGWAMEDTVGLLTVYADPESGHVLAGHAVGYQASIIIQSLVTAATFKIPAHEFARGQYWPHPALSEVVENALLGLESPA